MPGPTGTLTVRRACRVETQTDTPIGRVGAEKVILCPQPGLFHFDCVSNFVQWILVGSRRKTLSYRSTKPHVRLPSTELSTVPSVVVLIWLSISNDCMKASP